MPHSITLRSRTAARITGWYDGSSSRWSTDHARQRLFDKKHEAKLMRDELRSLCPRNAKSDQHRARVQIERNRFAVVSG